MTTNSGARIEALIAADDWTRARRAIEAALRASPEDHWLLSRLALTYYEQRRYGKALAIERRALQLAPHCPLSLWGLAGALGMRWARGLVADCWYRIGGIREEQGDGRGAKSALRRHLALRARGSSIYSAREVRSRLRALR